MSVTDHTNSPSPRVFISYSHNDSSWVQSKLLPCLHNEGLRICLDSHDFVIGAPSITNMANAVERSRKTLLIVTPHWIESQWTEFESLLAHQLFWFLLNEYLKQQK